MEPNERIAELEAQVRDLTNRVERLLSVQEASCDGGSDVTSEETPEEMTPPEIPGQDLVHQMKQRMDRALRGDSNESIEARIGAVWLSRLGAVFAMTAIAAAARATFNSDAIGPLEKVGIGYLVAAGFIAYGLIFRRATDAFSQAVLGCGLAGLYFVTYAALFVDETRVVDTAAWGMKIYIVAGPALLGCLLATAVVAHRRRSQTIAGIGLFLTYYSVIVSCIHTPTVEGMAHALITTLVLAIVVLVFHSRHHWLHFSWAALIATHGTYLYFFVLRDAFLDTGISDKAYFWISNGFLTICFILFSLVCVMDARKLGEYRRSVAPMSGVNSAVFLVLTYFAIRTHYPEQQGIFRLAVAAVFVIFAIFAETTGPKRNYLFQIFIAKAVILFTLALQSFLSEKGEILLVALAIECLGLGWSYRRSGIVVFKVLGLLLALVTFAGAIASVKIAGEVPLGKFLVPANWFSAVGVAFVFQIVAWFYEKFVRPFDPEVRTSSGQWFMADTFVDVPPVAMAMIHAAGGAFILLAITIVEAGGSPILPYFLGAEAALAAAVGMILLTPQIEVASVLLLVAAHVCYHVCLWREMPSFETQDYYVPFTVALALFTYVGAYAWEHFLRRFRYEGHDMEHYAVASVPYLVATFLLTTLIARQLSPLHVPACQGALAMALLLVGSLSHYPGVKASGIFSMALAAGYFYFHLYNTAAPLAKEEHFPLYMILFVATCIGSERLLALLESYETRPSRLENILRGLLIAIGALFCMLGLFAWSSSESVVLYLLAEAVVAMVLGAVFREYRYRWAALVLFVVIIVRALLLFGQPNAGLWHVLAFAAPAFVLFIVSWTYSHARAKAARREKTPPPEQEDPHD